MTMRRVRGRQKLAARRRYIRSRLELSFILLCSRARVGTRKFDNEIRD